MRGIAVLAALLLAAGCGSAGQRIVVAAGTTLVDSGLLDDLVAGYESEHPGVELSVVGDATARVLELGRRGGADLLITHAPQAEQAFVAEGRSSRYELALESRFVLVGPSSLASRMPPAVIDAFRTIAAEGLPFVSRADGSGTHAREMMLWEEAGIDPAGRPWYQETGQGMGLTLQVADQRGAFTLSELGAFRAAQPAVGLGLVDLADEPRLSNPYHVIVVAASPVRGEAERFVEWLLSPEGREAILSANSRLFGEVLYLPVGG